MAPTIGETLRKARTERGLDLSEVERATKIRAKFLEAMEADRWADLPAPVYARGFLDIYARHLGLDQRELLDQYSRTVEAEHHDQIPGSVIKPGALRQNRPTRRASSINFKPVAKVAAGVAVVVVVGLVIVGSIGGSDNGGGGGNVQKAKAGGTRTSGSATSATTTTATVPSDRVSVALRPTAPVWVCLVDERGNPLVDGVTLDTNEARGPFSGTAFNVTFGNGSVDLTVDGEPAQVPRVAAPIGYRITPGKVRRLDPSSQPTCV
jgi:cytoskeletal protein RodZ